MPVHDEVFGTITVETNPGVGKIQLILDDDTVVDIKTTTTSATLTVTEAEFIDALATRNGRYIKSVRFYIAGGETEGASFASGLIHSWQM